MSFHRIPLAAVVAVSVALSVPAVSAANPVLADLEAAHAYWQTGTAVPEPADAEGICRGRWQVIADPTLPQRGFSGEATGVALVSNSTSGSYTEPDGRRWDWYIRSCEFTIDPELGADYRRCIVTHEMGHFIHGYGHEGPMSPASLQNAPGCTPSVGDNSDESAVHPTPRVSRRTDAIRRIQRVLPGSWRVSCTPSNVVVRCRATRGRSVRRYSVTASDIFVRSITNRRAS